MVLILQLSLFRHRFLSKVHKSSVFAEFGNQSYYRTDSIRTQQIKSQLNCP